MLGFTALQLSPDRDPNALHAEPHLPDMVTLRTLIDEDRLSPARPEWIAGPPRISVSDPQTRAVLGYLSTNCGSCHNAVGEIANLELDLRAATSGAAPCPASLTTTVDRPGRWEIPTIPAGTSRRVSPGRPDLSAVIARMRTRKPSTQMPPLGTVVVDHEALALLTKWVEADAATWRMSWPLVPPLVSEAGSWTEPLRMVASVSAPPTVMVVTLPPAASFSSSARTKAYHSS